MSNNAHYGQLVPRGFNVKKTQVQRRQYRSGAYISEVWVNVFNYGDFWWYVLDIPQLVDMRSICFRDKSDLLAAISHEMSALGFIAVTSWEVLRHE